MVTSGWQTLPGETPIDDVSGLKLKGIRTRADLNVAEAENIRKAIVKYLSKKPSRKSARFDYAWSLKHCVLARNREAVRRSRAIRESSGLVRDAQQDIQALETLS